MFRSNKYECIKEFYIEQYDADGNNTNEYEAVKPGTVWKINHTDLIGGEVYLDNIETLSWIEISKHTLKHYFKKVKGEIHERD